LTRLLKRRDDSSSISSEKLYYRIGEVSRMTDLKPHVLRYWESEFKMIKPYKGGSLHRLYRRRDLDLILKIKKLLYEEGFTIAGAKKKIRDPESVPDRMRKSDRIEKSDDEKDRELLIAVREELQGIREMLE
jgi:DNA-binding transcriptional MerR regulator